MTVTKGTIGSSDTGKVLQETVLVTSVSAAAVAATVSDPAAETIPEPATGALRETARMVARMEVADAVTEALNAYDGSLRDLQKCSGLDPAFVSKLASGKVNKQGATVASLAQIALAMNKTLKITIE